MATVNCPSSKARVPATKCSRACATSSAAAAARVGASAKSARTIRDAGNLDMRARLHRKGGAGPAAVAAETYKRPRSLEVGDTGRGEAEPDADRERVLVRVHRVGLVDHAVVAEQLHVG